MAVPLASIILFLTSGILFVAFWPKHRMYTFQIPENGAFGREAKATALANLLIPVAISIAGEDQMMLAIAIALSCSVAMALPVSTPPNAIAFSTNAIRSRDMFRSGILISIVSMVLVLSGLRFVVGQVFGVK